MRLLHVDFELTYWRLRRRTQRLRGWLRDLMSRARAEAHLRYLHRTGTLPEPPQPEETKIFLGLIAAAVIGLVFVITIDAMGADEFRHQVAAVMSFGSTTTPPAADALRCDGAVVDFDASQARQRPAA